jgi:hypothetical protein
MPTDVNDPNLAPVSFIRGGLLMGGQVHLEGTYAFVPKEMAEWDEEMQTAKLGDVFYTSGIRRGYPPASQSYLSPEFRERITRETSSAPSASAAPVEADVSAAPPESGAVAQPVAAAVQGVVGQETAPPEEPVVSAPVESGEPFPGAATMDEDELRPALARLSDEEVEQFVAWERARPEPRQAILDELDAR